MSSRITPSTARKTADALRRYLWAEDRLRSLPHDAEDAESVELVTAWFQAGEDVRDARAELAKGSSAAEVLERQGEIFARNLAWLKEHHPSDPRIPQIEQSLAFPRKDVDR